MTYGGAACATGHGGVVIPLVAGWIEADRVCGKQDRACCKACYPSKVGHLH